MRENRSLKTKQNAETNDKKDVKRMSKIKLKIKEWRV